LKYIASKIRLSLAETIVLQLVYELSSACSVGIFNINNKEFYIRSMDWPMEFLKPLTIEMEITRDDRKIGSAITWIGYVGFLTANSYDESNKTIKYNIAINYRRSKDMTISALINNALKTLSLSWPIGYLVRDVIEREHSLAVAKHRLQTAYLVSPCYISCYVPDEKSFIITRDPKSTVSCREQDLVQTNCDHNDNDEKNNILWSHERRHLMANIAQRCHDQQLTDMTTIVNKFLVHPILNEETVYYHAHFNGKTYSCTT
jgi:hypothetical protein